MARDGKWTAADIEDQSGRIVIITGANSGIGFESALALAAKGATTILACRGVEKGEAALRQIKSEYPEAQVEVMALNLADLSSVRMFAKEFKAAYQRLDILINNAGVMAIPQRWETADGFEMQIGTNHLGHFALTGLLLSELSQTPHSRIVTVSSSAHRMGTIDFDNLNAEQSYRPWGAYGQSKIANLHFTYELQRRLEVAGLEIMATAAPSGVDCN